MKKILLIILLSLGIASCYSCAKKTPNPAVPDFQPTSNDASSNSNSLLDAGSIVTTVLIKGDFWEFSFPNDSWKGMGDEMPPDAKAFINGIIKNIVVIESKSFTESMDILSIRTIRDVRDGGATILSTKQVTLNGRKFVLVEAFKGSNQVWLWFTATGSHALGLSCGGPEEMNHQELCNSIANTLKLN